MSDHCYARTRSWMVSVQKQQATGLLTTLWCSAHRWMGWILKCAPIRLNTMHFKSCAAHQLSGGAEIPQLTSFLGSTLQTPTQSSLLRPALPLKVFMSADAGKSASL